MSVTIRLDTKALEAKLSALQKDQLPFALSLAINNTFLDFQKAERAHFAQVFTERRKDFLEKQGVKRIGPAATKRNLSITAGIDPKADFLVKFEGGTPKTPLSGRNLAIPVDVKRNKADIVTRGNRPRAIIQRLGNKTGAGSVFVIQPGQATRLNVRPGVYQRTGAKGQKVKLLYAFAPQVKTPRVLAFAQTFKATVDARFQINFSEAMKRAVATAK
jgi:hypothetical protein